MKRKLSPQHHSGTNPTTTTSEPQESSPPSSHHYTHKTYHFSNDTNQCHLTLELPNHQVPHIYQSSQFLAQYLYEQLQHSSHTGETFGIGTKPSEPIGILELGAGFNALPSLLVLASYWQQRSSDISCSNLDATMPKLHVYITDGAEKSLYEQMEHCWKRNISNMYGAFFGESLYDQEHGIHGQRRSPSPPQTISHSFCNFKWSNFYEIPSNVQLLLASDTIHNRNKKSWEDFFSCVAFCLRNGSNANVTNVETSTFHTSPFSERRLWVAFQRRDDNETIIHLLKKWKLEAKLLRQDDDGLLYLMEIRSIV